jgi:hypothetical protein
MLVTEAFLHRKSCTNEMYLYSHIYGVLALGCVCSLYLKYEIHLSSPFQRPVWACGPSSEHGSVERSVVRWLLKAFSSEVSYCS